MRFTPRSDHPVTDEAAKSATGKTLDQWFKELDKADGLKLGRREINNRLYEQKLDPWWCATIAVEYEKHHDVRKKDGLFEGPPRLSQRRRRMSSKPGPTPRN